MDTLRSLGSTLKRNAQRKPSSTVPSSSAGHNGGEASGAAGGESKVKTLMAQWKRLDENLSSFERLEAMRHLVVKGEMSSGAYDMLHDLAVTRATGRSRKPSVMGVTALEPPIMTGNLFLRSGKSWKKRYVLLFTERLEYHGSKQESERNRGLTTTASSLLILTEKFFVSDSSSRRLVNSKEHGFMVSDFVTTHYFAAETRDLAQYWMHILAKTIRKIQEAKAFFDSRPKILGHVPKSSEIIEKEYQERLSSYQSSVAVGGRESSEGGWPNNNNNNQNRDASSNASRTANLKSLRKSVRLKAEAEDLESKLMEHAVLQLEFQKEADLAEEEASKAQQALEASSLKDKEACQQLVNELELKRVEMEQRALLEATMVVEYEELVEEKQQDAAEAQAKEEIDLEIKRRSVAMIPLGTSMEDMERILEEQAKNGDTPDQLELKNVAIESVAKRVEEEQEAKVREADDAMRIAREKHHAAELASKQAGAGAGSGLILQAMYKVQEGQDAQLAAERAAMDRNTAIKKAEALHRVLLESKAALEKSRQQAAIRMGKKLPSPVHAIGPNVKTYAPVKKEDGKIQAQIDNVVALVKRIGQPTQDGCHSTTFGALCKMYEKDIVDSVESAAEDSNALPVTFDIVGLLVRGKRQRLLDYEGGNLFRGKDDLVLIKTCVSI